MSTPSKWFRTACDTSPCPMAFVGLDHKFKYINPAFEKLLGYSAEELSKKTWMSITHQEDIGGALASRESIRNGNEYRYTRWKRYIHKNGEEVPVIVTVWRFPHSHAPIEGFTLQASSNIREKTLEELKATHEKQLQDIEQRLARMEMLRRSAQHVAEFSVKYVIPPLAALGGFLAWLLAREK